MECKIVSEVGINHNGDMNAAKDLIDMSALCGIKYVKFQKRDINECYTAEFLDSPRESSYGTTQRDQKEGIEFGKDEYDEIDKYCKDKNMQWFASPWDLKSVNFLSQYDIPYIKIPSALITNSPLLQSIKKTNIPVIISTGMSTKEEVDGCINVLGDQIKYILACTSTYPTALEEMNMSFINTLRKEYCTKYKIGFSNHHPGVFFSAVSIVYGAEMIEVHITLDRSMYGSDQAASIEPSGLMKLSKYVKDFCIARGDGLWTVFPNEQKIKDKLRK